MANLPGSSSAPARCVLEGVPRVNFYEGGKRCPEDFTFPSSLRACLEYMGENYGCDHIATRDTDWRIDCTYAYILSTSGEAFRLFYPLYGDEPVMSEERLESIRCAFVSVGYAHEVVLKEEDRDNEAHFRSRIVESIRDRRHPVLGFGVIGPPECCIITGYDERGDVLVGWNFFQGSPEFNAGLEFEPSGYFRKRGWFKDTHGLVIIGEKQGRPKMGEVYLNALKRAVEIIRTPNLRGRPAGLAAYTAWAEALLRDEDFPADDLAVLREHYMYHDDAVGAVAEYRWYGSLFLSQIARTEAGKNGVMAEDLHRAAACYAAEHYLMWEAWGLVGGIGRDDAKTKKLAEPSVRRQIVPVILKARDKEAEAADHIERALAK